MNDTDQQARDILAQPNDYSGLMAMTLAFLNI